MGVMTVRCKFCGNLNQKDTSERAVNCSVCSLTTVYHIQPPSNQGIETELKQGAPLVAEILIGEAKLRGMVLGDVQLQDKVKEGFKEYTHEQRTSFIQNRVAKLKEDKVKEEKSRDAAGRKV